MSIRIEIEKKLGRFTLQVNLQGEDEVIALLGASGSGKTMTLRCIAGIEKPDKGKIVVNGVTFFDSENKINLSPQKRKVGYLFQNYALFPNMTVLENLSCVLPGEKYKKHSKIATKIQKIAENYGIEDLLQAYPQHLSGGEKQRVALARIMLTEPEILLLDEPFSALDSHLKFRLEQDLRERLTRFGGTAVFVSHSRDEVYRLASKVAVMNEGRILQYGDKKDIFNYPNCRAAAVLTGCKNIARAERIDEMHVRAIDWDMELKCETMNPETKYIGIRMHDIEFGEGILCDVINVVENPFSYVIFVRKAGRDDTMPLGIEVDKETWHLKEARQVSIHIPQEKILLLGESS